MGACACARVRVREHHIEYAPHAEVSSGDVHGNYKDLMHFASNFWKLGIHMCPAKVVFLGDYVDRSPPCRWLACSVSDPFCRGPHSIETAAYLRT